ncbi:hypothetical protein BIW11_10753, partial [Tropilaelaps mercedesae]
MTTQFLSKRRGFSDQTTAPPRKSVRHLVGRLLLSDLSTAQRYTGVVAAPFPPNASKANCATKEAAACNSKKHQSTISVISSDTSDSAIASRKDDGSDTGSVSWRANEPSAISQRLELSMVHVDMQLCTVAEKVQRWKDTIGRSKIRSHGIEPSPQSSSKRSSDETFCRNSFDNGLRSLIPSLPPQQLLQMPTRGPCSPFSGHGAVDTGVDADDPLTNASALSSLAFNGEDVGTANEESRPPPDWCELDTSDLKEISQSVSRARSDVDSLLADRRTSNDSDSWCSAGVGAGTEDDGGEADRAKLWATSLPLTDKTRTRSADVQNAQEINQFMDVFVIKIFEDYASLSPQDKSHLGVLARKSEGRSAFARSLDGHRAGRACLTEGAFLSLAQSTAVMLFECCEAGDWSPAKVLMNMCFTFYTEEIENDGSVRREYLCSQLSSQPIWKNLRFWNAAFFEAILSERAKFLLPPAPSTNCIEQQNQQGQSGKKDLVITSQGWQRPDKESQ